MPIHYETVDPHVVLITIDRPHRKNALDFEHFGDLALAWRRFAEDDDSWVAILTGVGDSYCAGADLRDLVPMFAEIGERVARGETEMDGRPLTAGTDAVFRSFQVYKPIIAAVNGPCVAGGMEMLGGIDIRIACPEAVFGVMEPRRGLFAGGGTTARLPRQLGWPAAMEFLLTAEGLPAQRALELGLLNEIVPREQLVERARDWAHRITVNAPLAIQGTKESALRCFGAGTLEAAYEIESEISKRVFATEDAVEGPLAFTEKRPPNWQGR
ncbi:MAG: enoyl-CoA hydratase-related protein [Acidimicrobiia bacterium]